MLHPLLKAISSFGANISQATRPMSTLGSPGVQITNGWIVSEERNPRLTGIERYRTGSEMLVNSSIVAASVKLYLDLISQAKWTFEGTDEAVGRAEMALFDDPMTPWHRIVRRAAFYLYWGFSIQEWTMTRRDDGVLTFKDVAPRAQRTIERWNLEGMGSDGREVGGKVLGVVQRDPNTYREAYLPRQKLLYLVDDSMDDSPEGLGLWRLLIERYQTLVEYERLEWSNFEDVALGTLIGMMPFSELERLVADPNHWLTPEGRRAIEAPLQQFLADKVAGKGKRTAISVDSAVYQGLTVERENRPSSLRQWEVSRVPTETGGLTPIHHSINRKNMELARVAGTEGLLLGASGEGSRALSEDKTHTLMLRVDGANREIAEGVKNDLLVPIWTVNGWPVDSLPEVKVEAVRFRDVEKLANTLSKLAQAGAVLDPDDPAIDDIRELAGLSPYEPPDDLDEDASLIAGGKADDLSGDGEEME